MKAVVTSSDIEFNIQEIDFGFCTVFESVRRTVTVANKSVLPQPFGFCGVPDVSKNIRKKPAEYGLPLVSGHKKFQCCFLKEVVALERS